jgi:osmotically inducible protein OsmC
MVAKVPGIGAERFQELAQEAKAKCPVSKALAAVAEISLDARLA